jgi:hypothetical protein
MSALCRRVLAVAIAGLGVAVVLAGCSPEEVSSSTPAGGSHRGEEAVAQMVPVTVDQGARSAIRDSRQIVVRNAGQWAELWAEHIAGQSPTPPLPSVSFATDMIVAVFLGERATSGYAVSIARVEDRGDEVVVSVEVMNPSRDAFVLDVLTSPFHIVTVPRSESVDVEFVVTETEGVRKR